MITLRLAKWPKEYPGTHIKTVFTIAEDESFETIIDEIEGTPEDNTLEIVHSSAVVPLDTMYYAKAVRYYDNGGNSGTIGPFPVYAADNINNENIRPDSTVEFPSIYVDEVQFNDDSQSAFDITTSNPRLSGPGYHEKTHWFITDENGAILFKDLYSSNLSSITVNKNDIPWDGVSEIKIMASHINSYKHESPFGILKLSVE